MKFITQTWWKTWTTLCNQWKFLNQAQLVALCTQPIQGWVNLKLSMSFNNNSSRFKLYLNSLRREFCHRNLTLWLQLWKIQPNCTPQVVWSNKCKLIYQKLQLEQGIFQRICLRYHRNLNMCQRWGKSTKFCELERLLDTGQLKLVVTQCNTKSKYCRMERYLKVNAWVAKLSRAMALCSGKTEVIMKEISKKVCLMARDGRLGFVTSPSKISIKLIMVIGIKARWRGRASLSCRRESSMLVNFWMDILMVKDSDSGWMGTSTTVTSKMGINRVPVLLSVVKVVGLIRASGIKAKWILSVFVSGKMAPSTQVNGATVWKKVKELWAIVMAQFTQEILRMITQMAKDKKCFWMGQSTLEISMMDNSMAKANTSNIPTSRSMKAHGIKMKSRVKASKRSTMVSFRLVEYLMGVL